MRRAHCLQLPFMHILPIPVFSGLAFTFLHGAVGKALLQVKWVSLMVFPCEKPSSLPEDCA